jgi:signal transduction histidine kinase
MILRAFIKAHRDEILNRVRLRVAMRNAPVATDSELTHGLPVFLDQLGEALHRATTHEEVDHLDLRQTALQRGDELFRQGLSVAQVVHDYGDLCQVITGLAVELNASIAANEFQTLNLCLDDAIAGAVTEYERQRERAIADEGTERLGVLAHEMRNILSTAIMSFALIKQGMVGPGGSTSAIHERSLVRLNALVDRSLADVRLEARMQRLEQIPIWEIIEEVVNSAAMVARTRGLHLAVTAVDHAVIVKADRQMLAAALANLVQNALKFTRPESTIWIRTSTSAGRVFIEVEDACGGLPVGAAETMLRPFVQKGSDRTGLGLGLSICLKAVHSIAGELRIRDLPGTGCVFSIELPTQASQSAAHPLL